VTGVRTGARAHACIDDEHAGESAPPEKDPDRKQKGHCMTSRRRISRKAEANAKQAVIYPLHMKEKVANALAVAGGFDAFHIKVSLEADQIILGGTVETCLKSHAQASSPRQRRVTTRSAIELSSDEIGQTRAALSDHQPANRSIRKVDPATRSVFGVVTGPPC
jgi:hypothetical protein